ncbi:hypothetical protein BRN46_14785, partial [Xanthomonas oryzae pv. oryzae]
MRSSSFLHAAGGATGLCGLTEDPRECAGHPPFVVANETKIKTQCNMNDLAPPHPPQQPVLLDLE